MNIYGRSGGSVPWLRRMAMQGLLADVNIEGHVERLRRILESPAWREIWTSLALPIYRFADLSLASTTSDALVWQLCQERQLILLTANRNKEGPDSLEATIQASNQPTSLPVFTLADPDRVQNDRAYAHLVAERLLQYLLEIDRVRGTGRLYLP